jgi:hypothetical protein
VRAFFFPAPLCTKLARAAPNMVENLVEFVNNALKTPTPSVARLLLPFGGFDS